MTSFWRLAILALCGFVLVACGPRDPYKPQLVHDASNRFHAAIWLRDVNFAPTLAEVFPVDAERQLVTSDQAFLAADARKWLGHYLGEKGLAAGSAESARYFLDVDVQTIEVIGKPKGMAYRTSFVYRITEAGTTEPLVDRRFDDGGFSVKPDNITWGAVFAAAGAGLAAGLTGVPAVVHGPGMTTGSESGLQPSILAKALVYGWRDAIARNADRYYSDMPSSISYNTAVRQAALEAVAAQDVAAE